jgi:FkbM family methyltransferase
MNLGHRSARAVVLAPFRVEHYAALVGMVRRFPAFRDSVHRYLTAKGDYPYCCRVRTPSGIVAPTLFSSHDISTVVEVFCREDYRVNADLEVAVDVGANIGISALYFLSRNSSSRVYLFEPDPKNVERLKLNLKDYDGRYEVEQVAVALADGEGTFASEPSGRYGTLLIDQPSYWEQTLISVRTRAVNSILEDVLTHEKRIDILKVDTEGTEEELVAAIRPELLDRIATIVYELDGRPAPLHEGRYRAHRRAQTLRLTSR